MRDLEGIGDAGMAGRAAHLDRGVHDLHPDDEAGVAFGAVDFHRSSVSGGSRKSLGADGQEYDSGKCLRQQTYDPHEEPPPKMG